MKLQEADWMEECVKKSKFESGLPERGGVSNSHIVP